MIIIYRAQQEDYCLGTGVGHKGPIHMPKDKDTHIDRDKYTNTQFAEFHSMYCREMKLQSQKNALEQVTSGADEACSSVSILSSL